jgi:hypothetical protein
MKITLAGHSHDAAIREIMRQTPMPGRIQVAFGREPDFFHGLSVEGKQNQVYVVLDQETVVAMGCRCIKPVYVNGQRMNLGYLGGLRLRESARRGLVLAKLYGFLKEQHQDGKVPAYLTTIVEENQEAKAILTSGRAGLPTYTDWGTYWTYAVNLCRRQRGPGEAVIRGGPITIECGESVPLERLVSFINREGHRRQFFPAIDPGDFGTDYLRNLALRDFLVASREGEIIGVVAKWDQRDFKQNLICGYAGSLRLFRPALNAWMTIGGFRPLPKPGECLNMFYVAFICIQDDDPEVLQMLLQRLSFENRDSGYHHLLVGFHERDNLRNAMEAFRCVRYASRLYLVCWDGGMGFVKSLDQSKIPYLELAAL